jgi:hypothetical protein
MLRAANKIKTLLGEARRVGNLRSRLETSNVRRLEALGAFQQIELYGFTFIQRAISVLLNCGEMDKHVLASGALDKSITLCSVKPLYSSLLSHRETPFA